MLLSAGRTITFKICISAAGSALSSSLHMMTLNWWRAADTLKATPAVHRDLDGMEPWADENLEIFKDKCTWEGTSPCRNTGWE